MELCHRLHRKCCNTIKHICLVHTRPSTAVSQQRWENVKSIDDKNVNFMAEIFMSSDFTDVMSISISKCHLLTDAQRNFPSCSCTLRKQISLSLHVDPSLDFSSSERRAIPDSASIPNLAYLQREKKSHLIKLFNRD